MDEATPGQKMMLSPLDSNEGSVEQRVRAFYGMFLPHKATDEFYNKVFSVLYKGRHDQLLSDLREKYGKLTLVELQELDGVYSQEVGPDTTETAQTAETDTEVFTARGSGLDESDNMAAAEFTFETNSHTTRVAEAEPEPETLEAPNDEAEASAPEPEVSIDDDDDVLDLMGVAGGALAKRLIPAVGGVVAAVIVYLIVRN